VPAGMVRASMNALKAYVRRRGRPVLSQLPRGGKARA